MTLVIIEKLNPCYIGLICCFTNILLYLNYDELKFHGFKILAIFIYNNGTIIKIFGILIYSENIILNFYSLNKNIQKNILIREKKEKENLNLSKFDIYNQIIFINNKNFIKLVKLNYIFNY